MHTSLHDNIEDKLSNYAISPINIFMKNVIRAKYKKQIDISLELLYTLSKMRNTNLKEMIL